MQILRPLALAATGVCLLASSAGFLSATPDDKAAVKPPAVPKAQAPKPPARGGAVKPPAARPANQPGQGAAGPTGAPIDRVLKMSPEERERWLSTLPPEKRQNIERQLDAVRKLPQTLQNRRLLQAQMLQSLPPQRQNQVRRSINQFSQLPDDRKALINRELQKISPLSDEDRRAYMNTEEFRNRYSANEQQIMGNLSEITPETPPHD